MNIRLIALDLDGTLLNDAKRVSLRNSEALVKARRAGIKLVISSGRIYPEALACLSGGLEAVAAVSACNGGHVVELEGGQVLRARALAPDSLSQVLESLEAFKTFYSVYGSDRVFLREGILRDFPVYARYMEGMSCPQVQGLEGARGEQGPYKVYAMNPDPARIAELRSLLSRIEGLEITSSSSTNIEITASGVDKGEGLLALGRHWGIKPAEMMALGDGENDLPMFAVAGLAVAMDNASPVVKAAASSLTSSNQDDGVAKAIEALLSGRSPDPEM